MIRISVPAAARDVIDTLRGAGFSAYLVGGCVRDSILGRVPNDWDVATDALPAQMKEVFSSFRTIDTGIRHGTVTVLSDGEPIEVTTFRVDGDYSDGRHPDKVSFTPSLEEDLKRRDFTVNAMAYSPDTGLVDLFSGREHLREKIIECVGAPDERFGEDGLRVLRAIRFASCLDFTVGDATADAVRRLFRLLDRVSEERIYQELSKLLTGPAAGRIMKEFAPVIARVTDVAENAVEKAADLIGKTDPDHLTRLSMLFTLGGLTPEQAGEKTARLKTSRADREAVRYACRAAAEPLPGAAPAMRRLLGAVGPATVRRAAQIRAALGDPSAADAARLADAITERGDPTRVSDLAVRGGEIMEATGADGREVGAILDELLFLVTEEKIENEREALLCAAIKIKTG